MSWTIFSYCIRSRKEKYSSSPFSVSLMYNEAKRWDGHTFFYCIHLFTMSSRELGVSWWAWEKVRKHFKILFFYSSNRMKRNIAIRMRQTVFEFLQELRKIFFAFYTYQGSYGLYETLCSLKSIPCKAFCCRWVGT